MTRMSEVWIAILTIEWWNLCIYSGGCLL